MAGPIVFDLTRLLSGAAAERRAVFKTVDLPRRTWGALAVGAVLGIGVYGFAAGIFSLIGVSRTYAVKVALNGETAPALGATVYTRLDAVAAGPALIGLPTSALRESGGKTEVWVYDPKAATVQARAVV